MPVGGSKGLDSQSAPSPLPSHAHQIMEAFLWNNKNATRHEQKQHEKVQSLILSRLKRSDAAHSPMEEVQGDREMQPLVTRQHQLSPSINNKNTSNSKRRDTVDAHTTMQMHHRNNNRHSETHPPNYQPMNVRLDDEEEDIVCCDGGHCHEGTKNLCTIALWAMIVFAIVNRFFVHMAMHLHKSQSVTPKDVGVVTSGSDAAQFETQLFANVSVAAIEGNVR
mmetsp:Transcript_18635/g.40335  ORF Transcript_18635/g.40335 Transcript_18635/m.40335 type:complete len:222 (-) Transcript_18635:482-1147(-)|eukprot:CAMPEP_0172307732 /NCGR_PEP_ID=MMETSP1058-20130122/8519_1 /TAXON_ID=83371 /ORGANISM="Detonula confervacea, Strain CCMP 353" /LENGTH=221 /DNA_ID=CAMNT_0013019973 /DNA_START=321 /DNA_END=986 /DNA_ORIENTATION=-